MAHANILHCLQDLVQQVSLPDCSSLEASPQGSTTHLQVYVASLVDLQVGPHFKHVLSLVPHRKFSRLTTSTT